MDALFQIVTMFIPKAGVQLGGAPLTLNLVLLAWVILRNPNQTVLSIQRIRGMGILYGVLLIFGLLTFCLGIGHWPLFRLAQIVTVVVSPLSIVFATRLKPECAMRITCWALIVVNAYGVVQYVGGIVSTSVPGLTYTYGQVLAQKNIGYGVGGEDSANKIISTYQNGNYLGLFCILGICLMLVWRVNGYLWKITRNISIFSGFVGLILCGSRSAVIPFSLVCIFLLFQRYHTWPSRMKSTYLFCFVIAAIFIAIIAATMYGDVIQRFANRIIVSTMHDSTGAGRTVQWSHIAQGLASMGGLELFRLLLVGQQASMGLGGEGLPEFFVTMGLPSTVAFYGMIVVAVVHFWRRQNTRPVAYGLVCVAIAFCIDQSFYYPPNVMEVFMVIGIVFSYEQATDSRKLLFPLAYKETVVVRSVA